MKIIVQLFRWIYDHALGLWVSKQSGEIFTKAALVSAVIVLIGIVFAAYAFAINAISLVLPSPFDFALIFIPDNTSAVLTALTTLRVAFFVASLKLGLASVGVR